MKSHFSIISTGDQNINSVTGSQKMQYKIRY